MIQGADLRIFEIFQQTFVMKCDFCNANEHVALGKLHSVLDGFMRIFRIFLKQLFLRKILDDCFCHFIYLLFIYLLTLFEFGVNPSSYLHKET